MDDVKHFFDANAETKFHFSNLSPPLAPSFLDVEIYRRYIPKSSKVLLLGYTKELLEFADACLDINPPNTITDNTGRNIKIIKGNWFDDFISKEYGEYDVIIGDGVLNLVGGDLVDHLLKFCNTLIIRFFTKKLEGMKYATYFRNNTKFILPDTQSHIDSQIFLIWNN